MLALSPEATRLGTTIVAAFLASLVECVEALTVILAVGSVRGWRSALAGATAAVALLAVIVAALGPALTRIPLHLIQLIVGTMILLFGLRWLRKAILRSAGLIPLHDEAAAFAKNTAAMRALTGQAPAWDKPAFAAAFNITMLEGTEVVFIVIALGAGGTLLPATLGALAALITVIALGVALHRPLARVPENTLKFTVGVLLSAFGTFWVGEGSGLTWPGADLSIPLLIAAYLAMALVLVPLARVQVGNIGDAPHMTWIKSIAREILGLFVDDGSFAIAILLWLALIVLIATRLASPAPWQAPALFLGLAIILIESVLRYARNKRR